MRGECRGRMGDVPHMIMLCSCDPASQRWKGETREACGACSAVMRPHKQPSVHDIKCALGVGGWVEMLRWLRCTAVLRVQIQPAAFWVKLLPSPSAACCLIKQKCAEVMRKH